MRPYLSIVSPVYNEEEGIRHFYERVSSVCIGLGHPYEIIFVDDASIDGSATIIRNLALTDPAVKLIELSRNFGHQMALSAGLKESAGTVVFTLDSDLQHPPELLSEFIEAHKLGADIVSGQKRNDPSRSRLKKMQSAVYYPLLRLVTGLKIEEGVSDFRLYSRKALNAMISLPERERYLRGLADWIGFTHAKIPYDVNERYSGEAKYTFSKLFQLGCSGIFSFSDVAAKFCYFTAFLFLCLSIGSLSYFLLNARLPFSVLIFAIPAALLLSALHFFVLGLLGSYLQRIYDEVRQRPGYVVKARYGFDDKFRDSEMIRYGVVSSIENAKHENLNNVSLRPN